MATESDSTIIEGAYSQEAKIITAIADEAITMWSPVIIVTAGSGESLPRVEPTDSANNGLVYGVVVGPLRDTTNSYAASEAGQNVLVCVEGQCKCRVDGNASAIAVGDALVTHAADGYAQAADFSTETAATDTINAALAVLAAVFATALKASTTDGDIIPVYVKKSVGTTA